VNGADKNQGAICGYVLAGGASSRFGRDKALAKLGGRTVLARMCDLVEAVTGSVRVVASVERYPDFHTNIVEDRWPGEGPLGGIITALHATAASTNDCDWNLIVSCDMPFLTRDWLKYMIERARSGAFRTPVFVIPSEARGLLSDAVDREAQVIVPRSGYGLEPLCACWRTSAADPLQRVFDEGVRKVTESMKRLRMEVLDETHWKRFDSAGRLFWNMNTQQDYEDAVRVWEAEQA